MTEETVFPAILPWGEHRDVLLGPQGQVIWERPWQHNLIVNEIRKLFAALMKGDNPQAEPLSFWAIGTGESTWDTGITPSDEERQQRTTLYTESSRKRIENITFLGGEGDNFTNQLEISIEFTFADVGNDPERGKLREFGLFAGQANSTLGSGILVNHRIHPRIDLQAGLVLQRTLRLTF